MAETDPLSAAPGAQAPQPQMKMLAHFVRDLSFENVGVIEGTTRQGVPDISVTVNLDGKNIGENRYQVNMKLNAKAASAEATRFLVELDYAAIFEMANVPDAQVHPMMFIEGPRLMLPFARRVIADITRDGGYPPLMLDNVDFRTLYLQKLEELRAEQQQKANPN